MAAKRPRVVAIVGSTGTGKTELACEAARKAGAEIISADSMQVYRGMDIGTAKPSLALRAEIPHHGLDLVAPDEPMSAGHWAEHARGAALEIASRGRPILLVGGTGLYARAFAGGLIAGVGSDARVRAELETRSSEDLRAELEAVDAAAAVRIARGDRVRTVRALEVLQLSKRRISDAQTRHGFADRPFDLVWLGLAVDRERLAARLRARVQAMFASGLVAELAGLHEAGYAPELRPLRAIGYREAGDLLAGRIGEAEAIERAWIATRRYAKRQRTWFRAEPELDWLDADAREAALERVLRELSRR